MRFHVLTLFPEMFASYLGEGILARAQEGKLVSVNLHDIRDYTHDRHRTVDDYPYGGGPGMVIKPAPLFEAVETIRDSGKLAGSSPVILLTPQGRTFTQVAAEELASHSEIALVCGRYEGVDERVVKHLATDSISIGDYVLGGGELAAMVIIEAVSRLLPGVVGSAESPANDSFTTGLLQHPIYTRPASFRDWDVPEILLSGHHAGITRWRRRESLRRTFLNRPDLLDRLPDDALSEDDIRFLEELSDPRNS
jgi:tRNA (guanine37-N1)-methyltransferase